MHNSPIGVSPGNAAWANIRSEFDETFASKSIEVKPQAVLQTDSHSRSRHPISVPFVSENRCWNYYAAVGGVSGRSSCLLGARGERCSSCRGLNVGTRTQTLTETFGCLTPGSEEQMVPLYRRASIVDFSLLQRGGHGSNVFARLLRLRRIHFGLWRACNDLSASKAPSTQGIRRAAWAALRQNADATRTEILGPLTRASKEQTISV